MRPDMAKVIVERPRRSGGYGKHGRRANVPLEDRPGHEGIRRPHLDRKSLNENLRPLERFIETRVGRPWDTVYSEICQNINVNSAVQAHVRQHVPDLVCLQAQFIDGQWHDVSGGRSFRGGPRKMFQSFFVHPRSGLLTRNPWKYVRHPLRRAGPRFLEFDGKTFRPVRGIWYELTFAPLPTEPQNPVYDSVLSREIPYPYNDLRDLYRRPVYVPHKRQLNSREIAHLPVDRRQAVEAQVHKDETQPPERVPTVRGAYWV